MSRSHVPKFGNWEGDNVPYTAYIENARIEKAGGMRINPNDQEENPDAFNFRQFEDGKTSLPVPASLHISPDKPVAAEKYHRGGPEKGSSHKIIASESGSDRSSSLVRPHHRHRRSHRNNSSIDSHISSSSVSSKLNYIDDLSERSACVPKFGDWNEKDPRAGEGFTALFNKVKEEKQIAAAKFPPVPVQTADHKTATRSKRCCCLF